MVEKLIELLNSDNTYERMDLCSQISLDINKNNEGSFIIVVWIEYRHRMFYFDEFPSKDKLEELMNRLQPIADMFIEMQELKNKLTEAIYNFM
jgi:hypothetical protein